MQETGDDFDVIAVRDANERYRITPVVVFGRAGSMAVGAIRGSWSTWSYHLKGRDEVVAVPDRRPDAGERPDAFTLCFGDAADAESEEPAGVFGDVAVRLAPGGRSA